MTNGDTGKKKTLWNHFVTEIWRLVLLCTAYIMLISLIADVYHKLGVLFSAAPEGMTKAQALSATPAPASFVNVVIPLPDPLAELIIICIVIGIITYVVLRYVCETEWVQEPVQVEECWEEVKWYNPFSWVVALVCTVVEVLKWVLKLICGWKEILVSVLVVTCITVSIIIVLA